MPSVWNWFSSSFCTVSGRCLSGLQYSHVWRCCAIGVTSELIVLNRSYGSNIVETVWITFNRCRINFNKIRLGQYFRRLVTRHVVWLGKRAISEQLSVNSGRSCTTIERRLSFHFRPFVLGRKTGILILIRIRIKAWRSNVLNVPRWCTFLHKNVHNDRWDCRT